LALPACSVVGFGGSAGTYPVKAEFTRAIGVYPGSPVRQLGIEVGHITDVENTGDTVTVSMRVEEGTELPADAFATIVPVTALGERYIQVGPVYEQGPQLEPGTTIPLARTSVPFEIDELLEGLESYLGAIEPENARGLVSNLAAIVDGQGEEINELIASASDTIGILADKGDELGAMVDSLAELSETLGGRTETIQELVTSYEAVSGVLADNDLAVNRFILDLNDAAVQVRDLLATHDGPLRDDVGELTQVGRTLQRNLGRLRTLFTETPRLFAAAERGYDSERNVLRLNNQDEPGTTTDLYRSRLRDRLAGLCRRLIVLFTGTPTGTALAASGCADTESDFWHDLFTAVPGPPEGGEEPHPPEPPAPPEGGGPPPIPVDDLTQGLDLILSLLDPNQLGALSDLNLALIEAIDTLSPEQLQGLIQLSPRQIRRLQDVHPDELGAAITRMMARDHDSGAVLDEPLLPPGPASPDDIPSLGGL
jgi:phospholipid/cholesterol/gamma-HCH transport system substrate-binding protein